MAEAADPVPDPPEMASLTGKTAGGEAALAIMKEDRPEEGEPQNVSEKKEGEQEQAKRRNSQEAEKKEGEESKKDDSPEEEKRKSLSEKKGGQEPKRRNSKDVPKRKSTRKSVKGGAGGDDVVDDDEHEEKGKEPKIIYPIDDNIQKTLRTAWTLFVKKNQKKKTEISEADVPAVMRSIGINPTEAQIQNLIAYAKTEDLPTCSRGFLTYENFEQRVAETLELQPELWIRKTKDEIMAALLTLCEYKDQIDGEKFKKLMMTKGDVMTDPEGTKMLRMARDRDTGMIYLDEYSDLLSKDSIPQPPPDPTVW